MRGRGAVHVSGTWDARMTLQAHALLAVAVRVRAGDRATTVASRRRERATTPPSSSRLNMDGAARPRAPGGWYVLAGLKDGGLEVECISANADGAGTAGMDFPKGGQSSTEQGCHNVWIAVNDGLLYITRTNEPDTTPRSSVRALDPCSARP